MVPWNSYSTIVRFSPTGAQFSDSLVTCCTSHSISAFSTVWMKEWAWKTWSSFIEKALFTQNTFIRIMMVAVNAIICHMIACCAGRCKSTSPINALNTVSGVRLEAMGAAIGITMVAFSDIVFSSIALIAVSTTRKVRRIANTISIRVSENWLSTAI